MNDKDELYCKKTDKLIDFEFDEKVAAVFSDMIERSVPGYRSLISQLGGVAAMFVKSKTNIYDLGCSLGAASLSLAARLPGLQCAQLILVDRSKAMLDQCRSNLSNSELASVADYVCEDIRNIKINNASLVFLNFTLQFIDPNDRQTLIDKIFAALRPGGALILSEKIIFADKQENDLMLSLHYAFKKANGYSDLEISQKRSALENVLVPETGDKHKQRLVAAGFNSVTTWYQCLNFISVLAIK